MTKQRNLYNRIKSNIIHDKRIKNVQLTGSVKENLENEYSDLDMIITVSAEKFSSFYNRENLEKLFSPLNPLGFFMYYKPPHWGNLCNVLFDNWIFVDITFTPEHELSDDEIPHLPADPDAQIRELYYLFWLDCVFFVLYLNREPHFYLEAVRGLNYMRDKHLLDFIFLINNNPVSYSSYRYLNLCTVPEKVVEKINTTFPRAINLAEIKIAFKNICKIFDNLYLAEGKGHDPRLSTVITRVNDIINSN